MNIKQLNDQFNNMSWGVKVCRGKLCGFFRNGKKNNYPSVEDNQSLFSFSYHEKNKGE